MNQLTYPLDPQTSVLETRIERLPTIEEKLDALLVRNGISPEQFKQKAP